MSFTQSLLSDPLVIQIVPLLLIFLIPALAVYCSYRINLYAIQSALIMVMDSLSSLLPWSWSTNGQSSNQKSATVDRKHKRKHASRSERSSTDHSRRGKSIDMSDSDGYYPGLVNVSGTYCFMNSTIQALSSLSYLLPQIDAIHEKAEQLDVPTPVIDALQEVFQELNCPRSSYASIRPMRLIEALKHPSPSVARNNSLMYSREHQDAQELFQLVSECIKTELAEVDKEGHRDRGFAGLGLDKSIPTNREFGKSVFDGLTANRRSCMECGYTEAVMHFSFDNWQLAVPRLATRCRLEDCLQDYTRLELLTDCICRRCSMLETHRKLLQDVEKLKQTVESEPNPSTSKKKRYKEAKRMEAKVKATIAEGRIEEDIRDLKLEKVFSKASTKQAMIARPPPVLALHINRSLHYGSYAAKNTINVQFPELLDLTPFTTSGKLSTVPSAPMSTTLPVHPRSTTPTPSTYATPRSIYRLASVVCHFGQHSFGHYICYRRKPRPVDCRNRWHPPRLLSDPIAALQRASEMGSGEQIVWADDNESDMGAGTGRGWLRISDDSVSEVGIETVLAQGSAAFMIYYERVSVSPYSHSPAAEAAMASDETLKPVATLSSLSSLSNGHANGSMTSLLSDTTSDLSSLSSQSTQSNRGRMIGPRIIRNMSTRRAQSLGSATTGEPLSNSVSALTTDIVPLAESTTPLSASLPTSLSNGHAKPLTDAKPYTPSPPPSPAPRQPSSFPATRAFKKPLSGNTSTSTAKSIDHSPSANSFIQSPQPLLPAQPVGLSV